MLLPAVIMCVLISAVAVIRSAEFVILILATTLDGLTISAETDIDVTISTWFPSVVAIVGSVNSAVACLYESS